jgi:hypothetical protein
LPALSHGDSNCVGDSNHAAPLRCMRDESNGLDADILSV